MGSKKTKEGLNVDTHLLFNATTPIDRSKHKQEVQRQRMIKRRRKMKMTDRSDDIYRDPKDSDEEFLASDLPKEVPQDSWLNDLLGPPSSQVNRTQTAGPSTEPTQNVETELQEKQYECSNCKSVDKTKRGTPTLSALMSKAVNTAACHPTQIAIIILAVIVLQWISCRTTNQ